MDPSQLINLESSTHKTFLKSKTNHWEIIYSIDDYLSSLYAQPPEGFRLVNGVLVADGVSIDPQSKIIGRAIIGRNTKIREGVLLRDGVIIGEDCEIGHAGEIKHSIILGQTKAAHFNYVGDSLVGNAVNLAAGVILANFKNGSKNLEVSVEIGGKKTSTGINKLGALIGDETKIGSNAVTDPGTIIGKNCLIYPLSLIRGTIPPNKIVKNRLNLEIVDKE